LKENGGLHGEELPQQLVDEYGIRQRTEFRFYERREEEEDGAINVEQLFELPEKKRLLIVPLNAGEKVSILI
jgi:hypothetical protein